MPPRRNKNRRNSRRIQPVDPLADSLLPQRILDSILSLLPVRSLVRFKRVCKPWSNRLTDGTFINMHYNRYALSRKPFTFKSDILDFSTLGLNPARNLSKTNPQLAGDIFLASCKGLVCIGRPLVTRKIILWNPATRLWKFLPDSNEYFGGVEMASLGFGCNDATDDYKVVRVLSLNGRKKKVGMEVYSSKSDSWETIGTSMGLGFSFRVQSISSNATVKGNLYWTVYDEFDEKITLLKFDSTHMSISTIDFPGYENDGSWWTWVDWEDQLGGLQCVKRLEDGVVQFIDVWVYDQAESSLNRIARFGGEYLVGWDICRCLDCNCKNRVIVGECMNGGMFAFDAENGAIVAMEVEGKGVNCSYKIVRHEESLGYVEGMRQREFTEDNQITQRCGVEGFLASIGRQGTKIEVYYALRF